MSSWEAFRRSVWEKGLASFETEEPVERGDDPVSEQVPNMRSVVKISLTMPTDWDLGIKRILVRSEHEEVKRVALSSNASTMDAFLVTGQPGISLVSITPSPTEPNLWPGKSEYAVLFYERATAGFKHLDDAFPCMKLDFPPRSLGRIWALANSHSLLRDPAPILTSYLPFFTIESVPSCQQRRKWAGKVASDWFHMKTWSSSEVLLHRKRIASRWIFELISDLHGKNRVSEMRHFYNLFQWSMVVATTQGWAFELWIHQLLREENVIQLFPFHCYATEGNFICDDYTASREGKGQRSL